ncbi:MAG: DUF1349 domain-containing protein [Arachnia sp.]
MTSGDGDPGTRGLHELLAHGRWTHEPADVVHSGDRMLVTAVEGSDAWRHTSYGFVHDSEHALLAPFGRSEAVEVSFLLNYAEQFDQAGLFLRASGVEWIKAGVEAADGAPQVGAVVTHETSDWSAAPVPEWEGRTVTIRASRDGDAVTIRARADNDPYRLVRVAHLDVDAVVEAGIFCAAPTRAGLCVSFTGYCRGPVDESLH